MKTFDDYPNYKTQEFVSFELLDKIKDLTNTECPICWNSLIDNDFDLHHVIPAMLGGSDHPCNLLKICMDCHSKITFGNNNSRNSGERASIYLSITLYGLDFFLIQTKKEFRGNSRYPERDIADDFLIDIIKFVIEYHKQKRKNGLHRHDYETQKEAYSSYLRKIVIPRYYFYREMFLGNI